MFTLPVTLSVQGTVFMSVGIVIELSAYRRHEPPCDLDPVFLYDTLGAWYTNNVSGFISLMFLCDSKAFITSVFCLKFLGKNNTNTKSGNREILKKQNELKF